MSRLVDQSEPLRGALLSREVTASAIRNMATQPNDTNKTVPQDHAGNR